MNKSEFKEELKKLEIDITNEQLEQLDIYYKMLIDYNIHTNLTKIIEEKEVYIKHFYDSLTIVKAVKLTNQTLLDVGTGAGFPGLVLKIIFPNLKVTLLDSLNKRIRFLNQVIDKLGLRNVEVINKRAEDYVVEKREEFDIVTSRAVANLNTLSEICIPFVKKEGFFVPMKADAQKEINSSLNAIKTLGGVILETFIFELPYEYGVRTIIKIKKSVNTSSKYPRKFSEIKKKPL